MSSLAIVAVCSANDRSFANDGSLANECTATLARIDFRLNRVGEKTPDSESLVSLRSAVRTREMGPGGEIT